MAFIGNQPISAAFLTDTFSGNGSTVAFTMTVAPANTSSIIVAVTGVLQDPSTYSVSGTTLTFSAAPPSGTSNISVRYLGIPASGVTTTAYRTVTNTTATAGQTSFTIPSYTVGYVDVYRNGVYLPSADYTATTGTTVVLNNACTVGDTVTTISFYVSSVLNAIPATAGSVGPSYLSGNAPQVTVYTSGSGTYTTPTYAKALLVRMVGGGGGSAAGGTGSPTSGGTGGTTTFNSITVIGGGGSSSSGGAGGTSGTGGTGTASIRISGGVGGNGKGSGATIAIGGSGGSTPLGLGAPININSAASTQIPGVAGLAYGGGASGPPGDLATYGTSGGGGGGEYAELLITSPSATYSYAVGAGGTAGTGTAAGGVGGSGVIIVTAFL